MPQWEWTYPDNGVQSNEEPNMVLGQQVEVARRVAELTEYPLLGRDPNLISTLASDLSLNVDQMHMAALEIEGQSGIDIQLDMLNAESGSRQRALFANMHPDLQRRLRERGYEPPAAPGGGPRVNLPKLPGWMGGFDLPELGLDTGNGVLRTIGSLPLAVLGAPADGLSVLLRAAQHVSINRVSSTGQALQEEIGAPAWASGLTALGLPAAAPWMIDDLAAAVTRPGETWNRFSQAFSRGFSLNRNWTQRSMEEAMEAAGDNEAFLLAQERAAGRSLSDILLDRGHQMTDPDWQDQMLSLYEKVNSEPVQAAVKQLVQGRMSYGNLIFRDTLGAAGPEMATRADAFFTETHARWIPGLTDFAIEWYADPLMIMGAARRGQRSFGMLRGLDHNGNLDLVPARMASIIDRVEDGHELTKRQLDFLDAVGVEPTLEAMYRWAGPRSGRRGIDSYTRFAIRNQGRAINRAAGLAIDHVNGRLGFLEMHQSHLSSTAWLSNLHRWNRIDKAKKSRHLFDPEYADIAGGLNDIDDWFRYLSDAKFGGKTITGTGMGGMGTVPSMVPHLSRGQWASFKARSAVINKAMDWQAPLDSAFREDFYVHARNAGRIDDNGNFVPFESMEQAQTFGREVVSEVVEPKLADAQDVITQLGKLDEDERKLAEFWDGMDMYRAGTDYAGVDFVHRLAMKSKDTVAGFMLSATSKVPKHGLVFLDGSDQMQSVIETVGLANMSRMPREMREMYLTLLMEGTPAEQVGVINNFLGQLMLEGGVINGRDDSLNLWRKFVSHDFMTYGGEGSVNIGGRSVLMAALDSETSRILQLPDVRELIEQSRKMNKMRMAYGSVPYQFADKAMSRVWKPAQLMRPGFILRAGGEEMVTYLLANGPTDYINAKWALPRHVDDVNGGTMKVFRHRGWRSGMRNQNLGYDWYSHRGLMTLEEAREAVALKPVLWWNHAWRKILKVTDEHMTQRAILKMRKDPMLQETLGNLGLGTANPDAIAAWRTVDKYVALERNKLTAVKGALVHWDDMTRNWANKLSNYFMEAGPLGLDVGLDVRLARKVVRNRSRAHALRNHRSMPIYDDDLKMIIRDKRIIDPETGDIRAATPSEEAMALRLVEHRQERARIEMDKSIDQMQEAFEEATKVMMSHPMGMQAFAKATGHLYDPTMGQSGNMADPIDEVAPGVRLHSQRPTVQWRNEYTIADRRKDMDEYLFGLGNRIRVDSKSPIVHAAIAEMGSVVDVNIANAWHQRSMRRFGQRSSDTMYELRRAVVRQPEEVQEAFVQFVADPTDLKWLDTMNYSPGSDEVWDWLVGQLIEWETSNISHAMVASLFSHTPHMVVPNSPNQWMQTAHARMRERVLSELYRFENRDARRSLVQAIRSETGRSVLDAAGADLTQLYVPAVPHELARLISNRVASDPDMWDEMAALIEERFTGLTPGKVLTSDIRANLGREMYVPEEIEDMERPVNLLSPTTRTVMEHMPMQSWQQFTEADELQFGPVINAIRNRAAEAPNAEDVAYGYFRYGNDQTQHAVAQANMMLDDYMTAPYGVLASPDPQVALMLTDVLLEMARKIDPHAMFPTGSRTIKRLAFADEDLQFGIERVLRKLGDSDMYQVHPAALVDAQALPEESLKQVWQVRDSVNDEMLMLTDTELNRLQDMHPSNPHRYQIVSTKPIWTFEDTEMQVMLEAADRMVTEILQRYSTVGVGSQTPRPLYEINHHILQGDWSEDMLVRNLDEIDVLPYELQAPKLVTPKDLTWANVVRHWFDGPVSDAINAMIREPMFMDMFAKNLRDNTWIRTFRNQQIQTMFERDLAYATPEQAEAVNLIVDAIDRGHYDRLIDGVLQLDEVGADSPLLDVLRAMESNDFHLFQNSMREITFGGDPAHWGRQFNDGVRKLAERRMETQGPALTWDLDDMKSLLPEAMWRPRSTWVDADKAEMDVMREHMSFSGDNVRWIDEDLDEMAAAMPARPRKVEIYGPAPDEETITFRHRQRESVKPLHVTQTEPILNYGELVQFRDTDMQMLLIRDDTTSEPIAGAVWFAHDPTELGHVAFIEDARLGEQKLMHALEDVLGEEHPVVRTIESAMADVKISPRSPFKLRRGRHAENAGGITWNFRNTAWQEYITPGVISQSAQEARSVKNMAVELDTNWRPFTQPEFQTLRRFAKARKSANDEYLRQALQRTADNFALFIDDHRIRSQLQQWINPLIPFWFAEEQFLMRMGRRLYETPEMVRRAQLLMNLGRDTAMIQKDEFGNEIVVIPGTPLMTQSIGAVAEMVSGTVARIPVVSDVIGGAVELVPGDILSHETLNLANLGQMGQPLTFQTDFALPGYNLDQSGQPQWGPLVVLAGNKLSYRFPEMAPALDRWMADDRSIQERNLWEFVVPTTVGKMYRAVVGDIDDSTFASAMGNAISQMEAAGLGPSGTASAAERDEYLATMRDVTRINMLFLSALSSASPASLRPESLFGELSEEFQELLDGGVDYQEAVTAFLEQNADDPAAIASLVFKTEPVGAARNPSEPAFDWIADNTQLLEDMPEGASWYIPQTDGEFSPRAWNQMLHMGLRRRRTPREILDNILFNEAAQNYFDSKENHDRELLRIEMDVKLTDSQKQERRARLNDAWQIWRSSYLNMHPVFAEQLSSPERKAKRERQIEELKLLALDPPDSPMTESIVTMTQSLVNYETQAEALRMVGTAKARAELDVLQYQFDLWARQYIQLHPEASGFYYSLIRPEIDSAEIELRQEVAAL